VAVRCSPLGGEGQNTSNPSPDYHPFPRIPILHTPNRHPNRVCLGFLFQTLFYSDEMTDLARRYVCCHQTRPLRLTLSCSSHALAVFFFVKGDRVRMDPRGVPSVSVCGQITGHNLFMKSNELRSEVYNVTQKW